MYCKYCGQELDEGVTSCQSCGRDNADQPVQKTRNFKPAMLIAMIAGAILVVAVVIGVIVFALNGGFNPRENNAQLKDSYTVSETLFGFQAKQVVATMGKHQLTNEELQIYYWMQFYDFVNTYGGYAYYYGLDYTKPLDEQYVDQKNGVTWQQYFLEEAVFAWQRQMLLCDMAEKDDYALNEEYQTYLANLRSDMEETAKEKGYDSVDKLIQSEMGPASNYELYEQYLHDYYLGNVYFADMFERQEVTMEELEKHFTDNESTLKSQTPSVTKTSGLLVDVRHILIQPEGGTTDSSGNTTYSDAQWEAARIKAQEVYDEYLAGDKTVDSFGELAKKYSADGNASSGGLYTYVYKGQMVKEFEDWCFDESRKTGDHGMVKTKFGYHIMYYVLGEEGWIRMCTEGVRSEKAGALLKAELEKNSLKVIYQNVALAEHTVIFES